MGARTLAGREVPVSLMGTGDCTVQVVDTVSERLAELLFGKSGLNAQPAAIPPLN